MKRFKNLRERLALDHCRNALAPVGSDVYYALRFTPKEQHPDILGILQFYNEIFNVVFKAKEEGVTQVKLNWWGDELTKMHQKKSGHPILQVLSVLSDKPSFTTHLLQLMNAIADGLANFSFARFEDLCAYLKKTIGLREMIIQDLLGNDDHETTTNLAISLGLLEFIQQFYFYHQKELLPIAQEDIAALHLESLFGAIKVTPDNLKVLLKKYHTTAKDLFLKSSSENPALKNLILRNKLALAAVDEIAADDYRVLEHQTKITPLKKLVVAWRR